MAIALVPGQELARADRIWHIRQTCLSEGLSPSDLEAVLSACTDRIYSKDEIIFHQGDPADSVFILNRGCVRISVTSSDDREKILGIYTTGDLFGESVLGPQEYFQNQAVAHEESWVSKISREHFLSLIRQRSSIALNYVKILSQRLRETQEDLKAQSFLDTQHRLQKVLLKLAEKYGRPVLGKDGTVKLKIMLAHEHLARLIGANRPHVSMIISNFKKRGWIGYQARKLLINVEELKRIPKLLALRHTESKPISDTIPRA